ncbi:ATP/GTP-binding protein [Embleya sp. NPDC056575]|uniref:ATP/GTP-binding protein n=1 Tax=unclassified Embleya TaxID=2699296 RepID=UPI0036B0DDB0
MTTAVLTPGTAGATDPTTPPTTPPDISVVQDSRDNITIDVSRQGQPSKPGGQPSGGGSTVPTGTGSGPAPTPVDPRDPNDTQCPGAAVVLDATSCMNTIDPGGGNAGTAPTPPTPAELGARASAQILLDAPTVHLTPGPGKTGLVGLPTWLWVDATPTSWGPTSATAAVPGLSVTATATVDHIVWDMGDGTRVTCTTPGTPYTAAEGAHPSPNCGHTYTHPGVRTVTATTYWTITWSGGGQTGTLATTRTTTIPGIRTGEMQALTS